MNASIWATKLQNSDRQRHLKRMAILETASKLFNEQGYDRTSIDDIAKQLNISKRTLYYYVDSKEKILFECDRLALVFFNTELAKKPPENLPALERLRDLLLAYATLLSTNFGACLVLSNANILSDESREYMLAQRRNLDVRARVIIQDGIDDGTIKPCDPAIVTAGIFGSLNWLPHWRPTGDAEDYRNIASQFISMNIDGIRS